MITLAHIAITQDDIDARGSAHMLEEAIKRLGDAWRKELERKRNDPSRVFRFDLTMENEQ